MRALPFLLLGLLPQDRQVLRLKDLKGDRYTLTLVQALDKKSIYIDGDRTTEVQSKGSETLIYQDEVLEVDGVAATRIKRRCDAWWTTTQYPGEADTKKVNPLQGRTIILSARDGRTTYEGGEGIPEPILRRHRIGSDFISPLLPKHAVAPGDSWDIDEIAFLRSLNDWNGPDGKAESAKGKARFDRIVEFKGVRCAVLTAELKVVDSFTKKANLRVEDTKRTQFWLGIETGRLYCATKETDGTMTGDIEIGGRVQKTKSTHQMKSTTEIVYP